MKKLLVLGAGLVGYEIARHLSCTYWVTVFDNDVQVLHKIKSKTNVREIAQIDFLDTDKMKKLASEFDVIIDAMPGAIAFRALASLVEVGVDIVSISFFEENPFDLDNLARANGVALVVDCGVCPGLSNLILGNEMPKREVISYECYVGGLPAIRKLPWEYKAPFASMSVVDEYLRPARLRRCGKLVVAPALSDIELIDFPEIGTLEAFNTDGIRTLLTTTDIPNMVEKTLRYPGYAERVKLLRDSGFFSEKSINVNGVKVAPLKVTAKLLDAQWQLYEDEDELTVMRVIVNDNIQYDLLERRDRISGASSMARTTGYTCAAVAELLANEIITEKGVIAPEYLGQDPRYYQFIKNYLGNLGVVYAKTVH